MFYVTSLDLRKMAVKIGYKNKESQLKTLWVDVRYLLGTERQTNTYHVYKFRDHWCSIGGEICRNYKQTDRQKRKKNHIDKAT